MAKDCTMEGGCNQVGLCVHHGCYFADGPTKEKVRELLAEKKLTMQEKQPKVNST